jgi:CheY-like chemotaxis protein/HPt (histidine-containing phosphotransfer) domain-containing protein
MSDRSETPRAVSLPHRRMRPVRDGILVAAALFVAACGCLAVLQASSTAALREDVRGSLERTASAAALLVDGDVHPSFMARDRQSSPEYRRAVVALRKLLDTTSDLKRVYTCVLENGQIRLVLEATSSGDSPEPRPAASAALREALATGRATADVEPRSDAAGTVMSGYAPFENSRGEIAGAVGVDLGIATYLARIAGLRRAAIFGACAALLLAIAAGAAVVLVRRAAARAKARIESAFDELARALRVEEAGSQAKSDFLATMRSEIRAPMNGVVETTDRLLDTGLDGSQREYARTIRSCAARLLELIDDRLDVSKVEAGRTEPESAQPGGALPFEGEAPSPAVESAHATAPPPVGSTASRRILVVDDNEVNRRLADIILSKLGHRVELASNGREAVALASASAYDLVFMDCQMPEMDGFEATIALRERERATAPAKRLPIVAMTASTGTEDHRRCLDVGMDDTVTKPLEKGLLAAAIERWTGDAAAKPAPEPAPAPLPDVLDAAVVAQLLDLADDSDPSFLGGMIDAFAVTSSETLQGLRGALERGEAEPLERAAHALKGSSGSLGATRVAALCARLQEIGRAGSVEGAAPLVAALDGELRDALAALERHRPS